MDFICRECQSTAIKLPEELHVRSLVRCANCDSLIGSWEDFKRTVSRIVNRMHDDCPLSADPIVND